MAHQRPLASTYAPVRRRDSWVSAWLPLLLSMGCLTAPVAAEAATVWNGPKVVFTKANGADPNQAANQDRLTSNVWLTRGGSQGLYNVAREAFFTHSVSPADTEWASGTTANYASLKYTDWETWAKSVGNPPATPGVNAVLHLKTDGIYLDIKFLSWDQRSGGFSYERSTTATQGAVTLSLTTGWNLVGNSSSGSLDVLAAFGDAQVSSVWKWIASGAKWAFYAPSLAGQALTDYAVGKGYEVLTTVSAGEGFWVNAKVPFATPLPAGTLITSGAFATMSTGWNLIAIGDNKTPSQFSAITPVTTLWAWDAKNSAWYFYAPTLDASSSLGSYISSKGYLDFTTAGKTLGQGVGFWVNR